MEIYKLKTSGKYFIYLEDIGMNEALFVNPICKIFALSFSNFPENPEEGTADHLISKNLITPEQAERFKQYRQDRSAENREKIVEIFESLSSSEKKSLIEEFEKMVEKDENV